MKSVEELAMEQPNAVIFRLPDQDDDGKAMFGEIDINPDGTLADEMIPFTVGEDDTFNDMAMTTIVLAFSEGHETSVELASFELEGAEVWEVMQDLDDLVPKLIAAWNTSGGNTVQ